MTDELLQAARIIALRALRRGRGEGLRALARVLSLPNGRPPAGLILEEARTGHFSPEVRSLILGESTGGTRERLAAMELLGWEQEPPTEAWLATLDLVKTALEAGERLPQRLVDRLLSWEIPPALAQLVLVAMARGQVGAKAGLDGPVWPWAPTTAEDASQTLLDWVVLGTDLPPADPAYPALAEILLQALKEDLTPRDLLVLGLRHPQVPHRLALQCHLLLLQGVRWVLGGTPTPAEVEAALTLLLKEAGRRTQLALMGDLEATLGAQEAQWLAERCLKGEGGLAGVLLERYLSPRSLQQVMAAVRARQVQITPSPPPAEV